MKDVFQNLVKENTKYYGYDKEFPLDTKEQVLENLNYLNLVEEGIHRDILYKRMRDRSKELGISNIVHEALEHEVDSVEVPMSLLKRYISGEIVANIFENIESTSDICKWIDSYIKSMNKYIDYELIVKRNDMPLDLSVYHTLRDIVELFGRDNSIKKEIYILNAIKRVLGYCKSIDRNYMNALKRLSYLLFDYTDNQEVDRDYFESVWNSMIDESISDYNTNSVFVLKSIRHKKDIYEIYTELSLDNTHILNYFSGINKSFKSDLYLYIIKKEYRIELRDDNKYGLFYDSLNSGDFEGASKSIEVDSKAEAMLRSIVENPEMLLSFLRDNNLSLINSNDLNLGTILPDIYKISTNRFITRGKLFELPYGDFSYMYIGIKDNPSILVINSNSEFLALEFIDGVYVIKPIVNNVSFSNIYNGDTIRGLKIINNKVIYMIPYETLREDINSIEGMQAEPKWKLQYLFVMIATLKDKISKEEDEKERSIDNDLYNTACKIFKRLHVEVLDKFSNYNFLTEFIDSDYVKFMTVNDDKTLQGVKLLFNDIMSMM